jgi:hypothetical protein
MKFGKSIQELAVELDRQASAKRDLLVDTSALQLNHSNGALSLSIDYAQAGAAAPTFEQMNVNEIAHRQIGQHLGIPAKYYQKMRDEYPELLTQNVNGWFNQTPTRRMIRTLDGTARAFLSDRYRRIDNFEVAQTVLPIISRMPGASIESCDLTDQRLYIKVVDPRVTAEIVKGDVVQAGVIITNSEVGLGSVNVSPLIFRLVCSNGMIAQDAGIRKYHVGRLNEQGGDNYEIYRDETIEADDKAFLMKLEDTVRAAVDQAQFSKLVDRLRDSTAAKIEAANVPRVVELAASEFNLTQDEGKGILGHLIEGGDLSLYGLGNAVTRHAHDVDSYDRSTELEATGYKIITINPAIWRRINSEAARA